MATANARAAIAKFVDGNAHRLVEWLDRIAKDNPAAAFDRYMSVVEYHIPKLQRQEITGKDGERLQVNVVSGLPTIEGTFEVIETPVIEFKGKDEVLSTCEVEDQAKVNETVKVID